MINLEKIKYKKCQLPPFKKTCPCTTLPPPFLIFSELCNYIKIAKPKESTFCRKKQSRKTLQHLINNCKLFC